MLGGVFIKEFSILRRHGEACPFYISSYNNINEAKEALYIMTNYEEKRRHFYFVDNDFFENKYPCLSTSEYFSIQVREVSEWEKFSEQSNLTNKNNILYFHKFKI